MSEETDRDLAIRAEERANYANRRLDVVNGSIDRLKAAVQTQSVTLTGRIDDARRESKEQFDAIMRKLAHNDGVQEGTRSTRRSFLDSKWRVITVCASLATSGLGVALLTYLLRRHTGG